MLTCTLDTRGQLVLHLDQSFLGWVNSGPFCLALPHSSTDWSKFILIGETGLMVLCTCDEYIDV